MEESAVQCSRGRVEREMLSQARPTKRVRRRRPLAGRVPEDRRQPRRRTASHLHRSDDVARSDNVTGNGQERRNKGGGSRKRQEIVGRAGLSPTCRFAHCGVYVADVNLIIACLSQIQVDHATRCPSIVFYAKNVNTLEATT